VDLHKNRNGSGRRGEGKTTRKWFCQRLKGVALGKKRPKRGQGKTVMARGEGKKESGREQTAYHSNLRNVQSQFTKWGKEN